MNKNRIIRSVLILTGGAAIPLIALFMYAVIFERTHQHIENGYYLEHFNEGGDVFYVIKKRDDTLCGVFEGTVTDIGWNKRFLITNVTKCSRGDSDGWYFLNFATGEIGLIQDTSEIESHPDYAGITIHDVRAISRR